MSIKPRLALTIPNKPDQYFSFPLKKEIGIERAEYGTFSKMLIISDVEGNFAGFRRQLIMNGVIDRSYKWIFEDGHLVIVGDCFDRGEQVTECLWLIYGLEEKARRKGGCVHFILGNHEIMNLNGDWRYVHPKYAPASKSAKTALYNGNNELWQWLCTKNIIEKVGSVLFVHAGIATELLNLNLSVSEINRIARPYYTRSNELITNPVIHIIFNSESSPFWYRGYYKEIASEDLIDATLKHFNVNTIVTGHTVVDKVSSFFNGKVINVDTDHASGNSEALLIKKHRFYRIDKDGKRERLK
jgi:hypothetical protein